MEVDRLRSYVEALPKVRSYTPSPSENRSFLLRRYLGQAMGRQVNDGLDLIDPITPVADFIHRRTQGYPWNWDDTARVGGTVAGLAAPSIARPVGKAIQNGGRLLDQLVKRKWPEKHDTWSHRGNMAVPDAAPDFVVNPRGTTLPVPLGANPMPEAVINKADKQTGTAFTGGILKSSSGIDKPVNLRMMNPTKPRGRSPGYPSGYSAYSASQADGSWPQTVDPYSGKTLKPEHPWSHIPN